MNSPPHKRPAAGLMEALVYSALTFLFLIPQSLAPASRIGYIGDSLESVAIVGFVGHQIAVNPARIFDAGFLHPQENALTLTDHRLLPSLAVAPVLWMTDNSVLAYNAALWFAYVLAAFGGRYAAVALGLQRLPAGFAGALFAFHTYAINEAPRLNIVSHGFAAFALGALVYWLRDGSNRSRWLFALFLLLQGYSANYHLLYGVVLSAFVFIAFALARPRIAGARLTGLIVPGLVSFTLFVPVLAPYVRTFTSLDLGRTRPRGIDLLHYFSTSPSNWIWGSIGPPARLQQQGPHFVGFAALALSIVGLGLAMRDRRANRDGPAWPFGVAILSAILVVLSLGDRFVVAGNDLGPGPYGLLYDYVPGFRFVRIPERLGLFVMLGVGLLGGLALQRLVTMGRPRIALALAAFAVIEHFSPLSATADIGKPSQLPAVYAWLARQPREPLVEIPIRGEALIRQETVEMYFATFHHHPTPLGYTAYPTLLSKVIRRALLDFPSDGSLAALAKIGTHRAIVHKDRPVAPDLKDQIFNFGPQDRERRFEEAVGRASLDVQGNAAAAARDGRLTLEASFGPWTARSLSSAGETVYRFGAAPRVDAAPLPVGTRVEASRLALRTKEGDASAAFDDRLDTGYVVARPLHGDELIEARFAKPIRLSGVELVLRHESAWPTRFRIAVLREDLTWIEVARWDAPHLIQLVDGLLKDPRVGRIGFVLDGSPVMGISVLPEIGGTSAAGWNLPELRILESR